MNEVKLFKIHISVEKSGVRKEAVERKMKDTGKSFVGEGRRIPKDSILKIQTAHETVYYMSYYTYCFEGDQEKALTVLRDHVQKKVSEYKQQIAKLDEILTSHLAAH